MYRVLFCRRISGYIFSTAIFVFAIATSGIAQQPARELVILPKPIVKQIVLHKNAIIVDAKLQQKITSYTDSKLTLSEVDSSIKTGSVLNSGPCKAAPYGFNVKVVSTTTNGKTMEVVHTPAGLSDLFEKCEFQQGDANYRPNLAAESKSKLSTQPLGSGNGIIDVPVNVNATVTYNGGKGFLRANIKGHTWIYMYYKRTGIFGNQDDYLITGTGLAFHGDINNPDFVIKTGGKFELKTPRIALPRLLFQVGPAWISFANSVGGGVKIEGSTELQAGIDLAGYGSVDCYAYANRPVDLRTTNNFTATAIPPQFTNKSFAQSISVAPFANIQSKLYNSDQFVFYGECGLRASLAFNPSYDINAEIQIKPYLKGGLKGKFALWDYDFDWTKDDFGLIYERRFMVDIYADPLNLASGFQRNRTLRGTVGYVSSENGWPSIRANRASVGDLEKFEIHYNRDGSYSFIANNGHLLNASENGLSTDVYANLNWGGARGFSNLPPHAKFYIRRQSNGKYRIQGLHRYPNSWWYDHRGKYGIQQYIAANDFEIR